MSRPKPTDKLLNHSDFMFILRNQEEAVPWDWDTHGPPSPRKSAYVDYVRFSWAPRLSLKVPKPIPIPEWDPVKWLPERSEWVETDEQLMAQLIYLHEIAGLKYREIAEVTKLPLRTVQRNFQKARNNGQPTFREHRGNMSHATEANAQWFVKKMEGSLAMSPGVAKATYGHLWHRVMNDSEKKLMESVGSQNVVEAYAELATMSLSDQSFKRAVCGILLAARVHADRIFGEDWQTRPIAELEAAAKV